MSWSVYGTEGFNIQGQVYIENLPAWMEVGSRTCCFQSACLADQIEQSKCQDDDGDDDDDDDLMMMMMQQPQACQSGQVWCRSW